MLRLCPRIDPEGATPGYFDNAATTRTDEAVVAAMLPFFTEDFANPSAGHDGGRTAAAAVSKARRQVAALIGAVDPAEIVFTAGASEANNTALLQALHCGTRNEVITTAVEHPSVLAPLAEMAKQYGLIVHRIGVDRFGRLDTEAFRAALGPKTALVSVMWANNETGTLFPVKELAALAHEAGALFHSDAVQVAGKIPIDVQQAPIDFLSLSGHKFHGPKGIGALYVRKGTAFHALIRGGKQERGRRAGTENVPAIVGLGMAAELAQQRQIADANAIAVYRDRLESMILAAIPRTAVLGDSRNRVPGTTAIAFDGAEAEEILTRLSRAGIAASSGAACSSGMMEPSHVVRAMAVPFTAAHGVVRFSLSRDTTMTDVGHVLTVLPAIVAEARAGSLFGQRAAE